MRRKMVVFAAMILLMSALFGCSGGGTRTGGNETAIEITETTLNGDTVSLSAFEGQVVVINFWGLWCPYCKNEMADFYAVSQEYPDVVFLMVNTSNTLGSEDTDEISEYLTENGLAFEYILLNSKAAQDYGVRSFPSTLVIDKSGKIANSAQGMIDTARLKNMIDGAIAD